MLLELLYLLLHHLNPFSIVVSLNFIMEATSSFDCWPITVTTIAVIQLLVHPQLHRHFLLPPHLNLSPHYHSHQVLHRKASFQLFNLLGLEPQLEHHRVLISFKELLVFMVEPLELLIAIAKLPFITITIIVIAIAGTIIIVVVHHLHLRIHLHHFQGHLQCQVLRLLT